MLHKVQTVLQRIYRDYSYGTDSLCKLQYSINFLLEKYLMELVCSCRARQLIGQLNSIDMLLRIVQEFDAISRTYVCLLCIGEITPP